MANKSPAFNYFLKYHFFSGLKDLAVTWLIVTVLNQVVFFGACLQPYCILASIPHCLLISVGIVFLIFKTDWSEYTNKGFNKFGFDAEGYDTEGFNIDGYNRDCYDSQGYDRNGCDIEGYNHLGYDATGYDKYGYNNRGFNRREFNNQGYNPQGLDVDGFNVKGYAHGYDRNNNTRLQGWWINKFKDKNYLADLKELHNSKVYENKKNKVDYDYVQLKRLKESEKENLATNNSVVSVEQIEPSPVVNVPPVKTKDQIPLVLDQDDLELLLSDDDDLTPDEDVGYEEEPLWVKSNHDFDGELTAHDVYDGVIPPWQYEPEDYDEDAPVWANATYKTYLSEPPPPLLIPQLNVNNISSSALDRTGEIGNLYLSLWDSALTPTYYKKDWSNLDILLFYTTDRSQNDKVEISRLFTKLWSIALLNPDKYQEEKWHELFEIIRYQPEDEPDLLFR